MADYYPVLKKTVAALPENTGAARREIYQRARKAIVAQLKAYDPPLSPSEITSEQLRLEESIRKVEAEAARETLGFNAPQQPVAAPRPAQPQQPAEPRPAPPVAAEPKAEPKSTAPSAAAPRAEPALGKASAPATPEKKDPLKSAIDDARKLGEAADQATRSARGALDGDAPAQPQKREPTLDRGAAQDPRHLSHAPRDEGRALPQLDGTMRPSRLPAVLGGVALLLLVVGLGAVGYSQREALMGLFEGDGTTETARPAPQQPAATPQDDTTASASRKNNARLLDGGETGAAPDARTVTTTRITPANPQTDTLAPQPAEPQPATGTAPAPVRSVEPEPTPDPVPAPTEEAEGTEEPDAGETETATEDPPADPQPQQEQQVAAAPATPQPGAASGDAAVAQRAILYEEGAQAGSAGQASAGNAVWSVSEETVDGRSETVLKMRIEVPDRNIVANLSLKPNRDDTLPASHLLEVQFDLPPNFSGDGVAEVPGLVMKTTEEARGDALIGASVKVADGYFWVALSNIPDEQERNLTLLRDRGWIDIPMLYQNGKRAILTLEKGTPGTRAIEQATDAWRAG